MPVMNIRPGDRILFGRPNGEKTLARVLRVAGKTALVETLEARGSGRGSAPGKKWRVALDPRMISVVGNDDRVAHAGSPRTNLDKVESLVFEVASEYEMEDERQFADRGQMSEGQWDSFKRKLLSYDRKTIVQWLRLVAEGYTPDMAMKVMVNMRRDTRADFPAMYPAED